MRIEPVVLPCSTGDELRYRATESSPLLFTTVVGNSIMQAIILCLASWNEKTGYDDNYYIKHHESYSS